MIEYEVVGDDRRPAVWLSIVLIAIGILGCFTSTAFCPLALHMTAQNPSGLTVLHGIATLVADVVLPVWLLWRHRQPFTITLVTAAISLYYRSVTLFLLSPWHVCWDDDVAQHHGGPPQP